MSTRSAKGFNEELLDTASVIWRSSCAMDWDSEEPLTFRFFEGGGSVIFESRKSLEKVDSESER